MSDSEKTSVAFRGTGAQRPSTDVFDTNATAEFQPEPVRLQAKEDASRALTPGAEIGLRYRIRHLIGRGGMARVWLADDLLEHRLVAFKERLESASGDVEHGAMLFRREFFAMNQLQHPGTLKVYDCGLLETGSRYITMEVVGGRDLADLLKDGPLPVDISVQVLLQLGHVLAFVHSRLLVHCDITASNVRVLDDGTVKLMDFGIMHQLGMPAGNVVRGTPSYMAPEWTRCGVVDERADLYSVGVLAYLMFTGELPFRGSAKRIFQAHHHDTPRPPSEVRPLAPALEAIVMRLLEKEPQRRFRNAAEVLAALHEATSTPVEVEPAAAGASYLHIPTLVGRHDEVAHLDAAVRSTTQGTARAFFLGAPPGVGKSRLFQEFEWKARDADMAWAMGQCRPEGLAPLAPLVQALRCLVPLTPPAILDELGPVLARMFPLFSATARPPARDAGEEKIAVFDALSRWLQAIADQQAFVLCLEDLQWADNATVEHLNVLIRALDGTRGLVVGSYRSNELSRLSIAFQTVDEGLADVLEVHPLGLVHLEQLVGLALPDGDLPALFVEHLHATTAGNAFFATECLRALIEQGALRRVGGRFVADDDIATRRLPPTLLHAVQGRLATLSPSSLAFYQRVAPVGRVLEMPLLRVIAGLDEAGLFKVLDEGVARQFLQYSEGRYYFVHDTVREAVTSVTPVDELGEHHRRIAEYLERTFGDDVEQARSIGYHRARCPEPVRAIAPLIRAAAHALDNQALVEAYQQLREAASLLEQHPDVERRDELLVSTWGKLIEVAYNADPPACFAYAGKLFDHWQRTVDLSAGTAKLATAYAALEQLDEVSRNDRRRTLLSDIVLGPAPQPEEVVQKRAEYRILQAITLAIMGRIEEFEAVLIESMVAQPPSSPYPAAAHVAIGGLTSHTGRFAGVVEKLQDHLAVLRHNQADMSRRLRWAFGMGGYFMNMVLALSGRELDEQAGAEGLELADDNGFIDLRMYHLFARVVRASFTGNSAAFVPSSTEMGELMRRLGNPRLPERNLTIYTPPYYLERLDIEHAAAVVARGEQMSRLLPGDRWLKMYVAVYRASLAVLTHDDGADALLSEALEVTRTGQLRMETYVHITRSRFELGRGNRQAARDAATVALARATDPVLANAFDEILARRALAEVEEGHACLVQLELALTLSVATGNILQEGILRWLLAVAVVDHDPVRSGHQWSSARACFAAAGAREWLLVSARNPTDATEGISVAELVTDAKA